MRVNRAETHFTVENVPKSMDIDIRPSSEVPLYSFLDTVADVMEATREGEVVARRGGTWTGLGWYKGAGIPMGEFGVPGRSKGDPGICMGSMARWMLAGGGDGEPWPH